MRLRIAFLILLLGLAVEHPFAQQIGKRVGPQFPFLHSSARLSGLADASAAVVDDFSGFGSNPSTLGMIKKSVADYSTQRVARGVTFEHFGVAYKASASEAVAVAFEILHFGGTDFYTNSQVRDLGYEARTGLSYGLLISEGLSAGLSIQAVTATTGQNSVWALAGDIGFTYAPGKYIRYALTLKTLGSDYDVPAPILKTEQFSKRLNPVLSIGLAFDYPFDDRRKHLVVAMQNDKILGEESLIYRFGFEYSPLYSMPISPSARIGFVVRGYEVEPRLGLGVDYLQFSLDYAYRYSKRDSQPSHSFTVAFKW